MEISPRLYHYFVRPKWFTKRYIQQRLNPLLDEYDFNNKFVIDFGCGIGSNCIMFDSKKYIGLDYDPRRVEYASKIFSSYKFETFNGSYLTVPTNSIDYILIMSVLHHIDNKNILSYIREFKRVLKPQGEIIIMEPCFFDDAPFTNFLMKGVDKGRYIRCKEDYLELFNGMNWNIMNIKRLRKCIIYNEVFFTVKLMQ